MAIEGVDYAFPPRPNIAQLAAAGKHFACRYGGPGSSDKWLDPAEAAALSAAGIALVANAEGSAAGLAGGFAVGASWARTADAWFRKCGMPADRPIYLSVDFDVQSGQWPAVRDALAGAASEIGLARVGVYGGRKAIAWARRDEVATWFWQTYAWSGGVWEPGVHIQQYRNGITVAGADCDLNRAMQSDYGQWTTGSEANDMTPEQAAQLDALFKLLVLDPPVRVQGAWTYTGPDGRSRPISPLYNAIDHVAELVEAAAKGATPAELDAIKEAARAGAEAGAIASTDELAAAIVASLPEQDITKADVEAAVRNVFRSVPQA